MDWKWDVRAKLRGTPEFVENCPLSGKTEGGVGLIER
jgi:hypothetical protein